MNIDPDHFLQTENRCVITPELSKVAWERSFAALDEPQGAGPSTKVYLLVGPQGAGKSTWAKVMYPTLRNPTSSTRSWSRWLNAGRSFFGKGAFFSASLPFSSRLRLRSAFPAMPTDRLTKWCLSGMCEMFMRLSSHQLSPKASNKSLRLLTTEELDADRF